MSIATNISSLHVFQVLRSMRTDPEARTVAQISRKMGLPPTTVHRAIATLEEADFLERADNSAAYEFGVMPQLLARALFNRFPLREAAAPALRELAESSGETVSLAVRLGWYSLCIAAAAGSKEVYHPQRLGETGILHRGLQGRGMLYFLSDDQLERYRRFVRSRSPEWVRDLEKSSFVKEVRAARDGGFVTERDAGRVGFLLSLPVRTPDGTVIASLSTNGPVFASLDDVRADQLSGWLETRDELQRLIALDPARFADPFSHMDPDQVQIRSASSI